MIRFFHWGGLSIFLAGLTALYHFSIGPMEARYVRYGQDIKMAKIAQTSDIEILSVAQGGSELSPGWSIQASPPLNQELQACLRILNTEIEIYSPQLLAKCGVRSLVLCDELFLNGQNSSSFVIPEQGRIFLDMAEQLYLKDALRRSIHHEIFHMIDILDFARFNSDTNWVRLNAPDFRYGDDGSLERDPTEGHPDETVLGFLNRYSRSAAREDKAELYAHMVVNSEIVRQRFERDKVLFSKYQELKRRLAEFSPEMREEFWERSHKLTRE